MERQSSSGRLSTGGIVAAMSLAAAAIGLVTALVQWQTAIRSEGQGRRDTPRAQLDGQIEVVLATYGANCGEPEGNATEAIAAHCNGSSECTYRISRAGLGVLSGCVGEYYVRWRCGETSPSERWVPREASERNVSLSCLL